MDSKVLLAALGGAVVAFLSGWVIWGMALEGFFNDNTAAAASGIMRGENMFLWAIAVGCIAWSLLLALLYSRWAGISTFKSGAIAGAWIMFLVTLGSNMFTYAGMDIFNMNALIVDVIANAIQGALVGGVIGWALGYGNRN